MESEKTFATQEEEFALYVSEGKLNLSKLKEDALAGKLRGSRIRSLAWKVFFEVLDPAAVPSWGQSLKTTRDAYGKLKVEHLIDPHETESSQEDLTKFNPLSQDEESPWNVFFKNKEMQKEIMKDIERTYQELEFFQRKDVHEIMLRILFIYVKTTPGVPYRQGMHELLALLLMVVDADRMESRREGADATLCDVFHADAVEADAYTLFVRLMGTAHVWFRMTESKPGQSREDEQREQQQSPLLVKCQRVQNIILKKYAPDLSQHLSEVEIHPQIYGLRWIRLLFQREFHLVDVLVLWDGIFADSGTELTLVDYVCVSMLLYIKSQLISMDNQGCLRRLMKFPPIEEVQLLLEQALSLRDKKQLLMSKPAAETDPLQADSAESAPAARPQATASKPAATPATTTSSKPQSTTQKVLDSTKGLLDLFQPVARPHKPEAPAVTKAKAAPSRPASTSIDETSTAKIEAHVRDLLQTNAQLGEVMETLISALQAQVLSDKPPEKEICYLALAGMKQVKDILLGNLPYDPHNPAPIIAPGVAPSAPATSHTTTAPAEEPVAPHATSGSSGPVTTNTAASGHVSQESGTGTPSVTANDIPTTKEHPAHAPVAPVVDDEERKRLQLEAETRIAEGKDPLGAML